MTTKLLIKILQLFSIMIIGFLITKCKIIRSKDSLAFSKISLYLLMPSAIVNAFDFDRSDELMSGLLFAFLAAIVVHLILYLYLKDQCSPTYPA